MHGHAAGGVVGAEQPAPPGVHGQVAGSRATGAPAAQHLAVGRADGGHRAVLTLAHRVQRPPVRMRGEVGRVLDAGERAGPGDTAARGVVGGESDALAAALHGGVGAEVERAGAGEGGGRGGAAPRRCPARLRARRAGWRRGVVTPRQRGRRARSRQGADESAPAQALTAHLYTSGRRSSRRDHLDVDHPPDATAASGVAQRATPARPDSGLRAVPGGYQSPSWTGLPGASPSGCTWGGTGWCQGAWSSPSQSPTGLTCWSGSVGARSPASWS